MGRLHGHHPVKNNKRSRSLKLAWERRKAQALKTNKSEPMIFEDISECENTNHISGDLAYEETSLVQFRENETEIQLESRDGNWGLRKYEARYFIEKRSTRIKEVGIISSDEYERISKFSLNIEVEPREDVLTGNRIVELGYVLETTLKLQFDHSKICNGQIKVFDETRAGKGLISKVTLKCRKCNKIFEVYTENPNSRNSTNNTGAIWGSLATGSTQSHLEELLSCMDIPLMPSRMFYKMENELGKEWNSSLWRSMKAAGEREKEHAIASNHISLDDTPYITVYVDGSWSKRSYGTNFNSLSGMVGIIGRHTGEILFAAVRNKFCSICARAQSKHTEPGTHTCYKNWEQSASSMEPDMVVEGFNSSIDMHGVKYRKFIGNGDSSVFARIKGSVTYGHEVNKIECTNHALKNYGKHLYKIKADTTINLQGRKLVKKGVIQLITKRAKCSIYEHSKKDKTNINLLRDDLENGLHHVFGDHSKCRPEICNSVGDQTVNKIPELKTSSMYNHLYGALNVLVRKAHLLIENETNNRAERLMNIVSRFNMGKRLNLIQRGSYERRVCLSALRYNKSFAWHSSPWKNILGKSPGKYFKNFMERKLESSRKRSARRKLFPDTDKDVTKKATVKTNIDYGPNSDEPEEEADVILSECSRLFEKLQVTLAERDVIERGSVGQFGNDLYESERKLRLTASQFGRVVKRKSHTPCHNIVKSCLIQSYFHSEATDHRIAKESVALRLFESKFDLKVERSGLWVDLDCGFLAASPDGIVNNESIVEVKCIFLQPNVVVQNIEDVIKLRKSLFCLQKKGDEIKLNKNHSYYFQVQGQLHITQKTKCYFVIYVNDNIDLYVEEVPKDDDFWNKKMFPKLKQFYTQCIAPEIIRNNLGRGKKCVDPPYIMEAIKLVEKKKTDKETKKKKSSSDYSTLHGINQIDILEAGPSGLQNFPQHLNNESDSSTDTD